MKRPTRTIRRESTVTLRNGRALVLVIPPTADVVLIREKGRRTALEVDVLTIYHVAAKLRAAEVRAQRRKGKA